MNTITVPVKKVIILGTHGHIGSALFKILLQKPEQFNVTGTSRNFYDEKNIIRFNPFTDDWKTLGKTDILINCIGIIKESHKNSFDKIHIGLAKRILENREKLGNPLIIQISALGADKNHPVTFLRTKGIADDVLLKEENVYVIRPSVVCFIDTLLLKKLLLLQKTVKKTRNHLLLPKGFLQHKIQPLLIEDLTAIIVNLTQKKFNRTLINVAGAKQFSYNELIRLAVNNIRIKEVNRQLFKAFIKLIIAPLFPSLINFEQYQLLFYDNVADNKDVKEILGRAPLSTKNFWQKNLANNGKS